MRAASYPKIESVTPLPGKKLRVCFQNNRTKVYNCAPLLQQEPFSALKNESLFRQVKVDGGGYGVSWSDGIDLSESELWLNGKAAV